MNTTANPTNPTSPFQKAIDAAKAREAMERIQRIHKAANAPVVDEAAEAERRAALRETQRLIEFGRRFLCVVAEKVVEPMWPAAYIEAVKKYCEALLRKEGDSLDLFDLKPEDEEMILGKLAYGAHLAEVHGQPIPDDTFCGIRICRDRGIGVHDKTGQISSWTRLDDFEHVTEEVAVPASNTPKHRGKIVYVAHTPRRADDKPNEPTAVVELKSAITPKHRGSRRKAS